MVKPLIIANTFKIKIHLFFYFFALISILTGMFREFLIFTSIIIIHEFGHILAGLILKIYPEEIIILPFGGLTIFKMQINIPINKELFIAIMGPLVQVIVWFLFYYFEICNDIYNNYNFFILIFNLLPIYPLDGSKILNCLISKFISFKSSFFISIYLSFITISLFIICIFQETLSFGWFLILIFLLIKAINEYINFNNLFNKFLWERYNYHIYFKKQKIIDSIYLMKRDYKHLFRIDGFLRTEREFLGKRFDFKNKV